MNEYNKKLREFRQVALELHIQKREFEKGESFINYQYRYDIERKSIMIIGPAGYGKSLVANRFAGYKGDSWDASEQQGTNSKNNIYFSVSEFGQQKQETYEKKPVCKPVYLQIPNHKNNNSNKIIQVKNLISLMIITAIMIKRQLISY